MKIWLLIMAMLTATDAAAQSIFVTSGYYREIKRFSGDPSMSLLDTEANGLQIAVGSLVTPRFVVELEVGLSGESRVAQRTSIAYQGQTVDIQTEYANRFITWSALAGVRSVPAGRLQLTYLGGVTFFHVSRHITPESQVVFLQPPPPPISTTTVDEVAGPTVGVDAAFKATPHLAIVFAARAQALRISSDLSGISLRPGVAAQVSF